MIDPQALVRYYADHDIPMRPQPGFLVLSIIVSILGSYATLLLLGRRTSNKGLRNFGILILSAICFAAVAVWGMHFVSMISVRLDPSPSLSWAIMVSRMISKADVVLSWHDFAVAVRAAGRYNLRFLVLG